MCFLERFRSVQGIKPLCRSYLLYADRVNISQHIISLVRFIRVKGCGHIRPPKAHSCEIMRKFEVVQRFFRPLHLLFALCGGVLLL